MDLLSPQLRTRLRTARRTARRFADGSRGLSPLASAAWFLNQNAEADQNVATSATAVWCDDRRNTRLWIHNYWTESHRVEGEISLTARLIGADGTSHGLRTYSLSENSTEIIDVREWSSHLGLTDSFRGLVEVTAVHEALIPGLPLQLIGEYLDRDGSASSVHGQFGTVDRPLAQVVSFMRIAPRAEGRTAVVVANTFAQDRDASVDVIVNNANGESQTARIEALSQWASRAIVLDEVFAGLDDFLDGRPGTVAVKYPFPAARTLTYVERPDGVRLVDHGTIDRRYDQAAGLPEGWPTSPVCSVPVLIDGQLDTVVSLPNSWGPNPARHRVAIEVFDAKGVSLALANEVVPSGGLREVSLGTLCRNAGVAETATHAMVWVVSGSNVLEPPSMIDILVRIVDTNACSSEVQVGAAFFNAEQPDDALQRPVRRTRVFGRVELGAEASSSVFVAHPRADRSENDAAAATVTIRLVSLDGKHESSIERTLQAQAGQWFDIAEEFPNWRSILNDDGVGVVKVRSVDARMYGYYRIARKGAATAGFDHLLGG